MRVTVPEGVQQIGDEAFFGCTQLSSVYLPKTLTDIGGSAFSVCDSLRSIRLPEGLKSAGSSLFSGCHALVDVELPETLTVIPEMMFFECGLEEITIPAGVTEIRGEAFSSCYQLKRLTMLGMNATISSSAFANAGITTICAPEGSMGHILSLLSGSGAYGGLDYFSKDVSFEPAGYTEYTGGGYTCRLYDACAVISDCSLGSANSPERISVPASVQGRPVVGIGDGVFADYFCETKSITLPASLRFIGEACFCCCEQLASITLPKGLLAIESDAFISCGELRSITLPEGLLYIGGEAFGNCPLTEIVLPDSLVSIGAMPFWDCCDLSSITIKEPSGTLSTEDGILYAYSNGVTTLITCPAGKSGAVSVMAGTAAIAENAFCSCERITKVTIPASVTQIDASAFDYCGKLTILAPSGSYAISYAKQHDIPYEIIR